MSKNGALRELGHLRDFLIAITCLLYAAWGIALDIKSPVVWGVRDPDAFNDPFLKVYPADHPLAKLSAPDLVCAFASTFGAVDDARAIWPTTAGWTITPVSAPRFTS